MVLAQQPEKSSSIPDLSTRERCQMGMSRSLYGPGSRAAHSSEKVSISLDLQSVSKAQHPCNHSLCNHSPRKKISGDEG